MHMEQRQTSLKNSTRGTFCLSKTGPCTVDSSQIAPSFKGEVAYYFLCMALHTFLVSMLSIV